MVLLSQLINVWDEIHKLDTGHVGFSDMVAALESAGVKVHNDCLERPARPGFDIKVGVFGPA